jgi:hypothetical protein
MPTMAYDAARHQVVLFGGYQCLCSPAFGDTWTWSGSDWRQQHPATSPPAINGSANAAAYDPVHRVVVLLVLGQTWTWDGASWTLHSASGPPDRSMQSITYDAGIGRVVVFGGQPAMGGDPTNQLWAWDGTNWTQVGPV